MELDSLKQELYSARSTNETLTTNLRNAEEEITELKKDFLRESTARSDVEEVLKSRDSLISTIKQKISALEDDLQIAQTREKEKEEVISDLEKQVKDLRSNVASAVQMEPRGGEEIDDELLIELQDRLEQVESEKHSLELKLSSATDELQAKMSEISQLRTDLNDKAEEIEFLECDLSTQTNIAESLRRDNSELRSQLETEEGDQVSTDRKGNSLFAEVEDRRVAAEKHVVSVSTRLSEAEQRLTKSQDENKRLRKQMMILRQTATKGYDQTVVNKLQAEVREAKAKVIELTDNLHREMKNKRRSMHHQVAEYQGSLPLSEEDKVYISHLRLKITDKEKQIEDVRHKAQREHVQMLHTDMRLTETLDQVRALTHERDSLRIANGQLSMEIRDLQMQYEPEQVCELPKVTFDSVQKSAPLSEVSQPLLNKKPEIAVKKSSSSLKSSLPGTTSDSNNGSPCLKENDPLSIISRILSGQDVATKGKTVRVAETASVIGADGTASDVKTGADAKPGNKKRHRKILTENRHNAADEEPADCKQQ